MEYEILGIPEDASLEEAKKALNAIRLKNHPDKVSKSQKKRAEIILRQSESAYRRIKDKQKVNSIFDTLLSSRFGNFQFPPTSGDVYTSTYTYKNNNGIVEEKGNINGKPMTENELNSYRKKNTLFIL